MRWTDVVVSALVSTLVMSSSCSDGGSDRCPAGWNEPGDGTCQAPASFEAELSGDIGTGVYGWARVTEGNCMPALGCGGGGSCATALEPGIEIVAYRLTDVESGNGAGGCFAGFEVATGATAAGTAVVDDSGVYRMPLPAGDYALTATDPVDGCAFMAGTAHIGGSSPVTYVHFDFDHGAY
jgi:hypothetical protein